MQFPISILHDALVDQHGVTGEDDLMVGVVDHKVAAYQLHGDVPALLDEAVLRGGDDGGAYSGGSASSATSAGTKEQTKLAANQKGSGSGKKRRL